MSKSIFLLPGEATFVKEPTVISTLLGSCVALVLHHPARGWGGMNHFMLPSSSEAGGGLSPGKYADMAIPNLLKVAAMSGCGVGDLHAMLFGGGKVVGHLGSLGVAGGSDIGQRNIEVADQLCRDLGLRVRRREVGGTQGRKIHFDTATGQVDVKLIQSSQQNLEAAERRQRLAGRKPRILVIDDSATVRRILRSGIEASNDLECCGEAENPYEARSQILATDPDVLCLDIIMPRMDGLSFLRKIMKFKPIPTVIVSTIAKQGSAMRRKVVEAGAVDVVDKEELNLYRGLDEMNRVLLPKLRRAATTVVGKRD